MKRRFQAIHGLATEIEARHFVFSPKGGSHFEFRLADTAVVGWAVALATSPLRTIHLVHIAIVYIYDEIISRKTL